MRQDGRRRLSRRRSSSARLAVRMDLKIVKDTSSVWRRTWRLIAKHLDLNKLRKMEEIVQEGAPWWRGGR